MVSHRFKINLSNLSDTEIVASDQSDQSTAQHLVSQRVGGVCAVGSNQSGQNPSKTYTCV